MSVRPRHLALGLGLALIILGACCVFLWSAFAPLYVPECRAFFLTSDQLHCSRPVLWIYIGPAAGSRHNVGVTFALGRQRPSASAALPPNVPPVFQASGASLWCAPNLVPNFPTRRSSSPRLIDRCEPAASPWRATRKKKPGPANYAESGPYGAEHRIRTGDLRLGKALTRMCTEMQRESTRWNLRRSRSPRARQFCKPMQPESTALLTPD